MSRKQTQSASALAERITAVSIEEAPLDAKAFNLYYSSSVEGNIANLLGAPHYSYRFAESKFIAAMSAEGILAHKLLMPEYYNTAAALPDSIHEAGKAEVHLIFRSTEQIRLLKFAWNICCFAWEFEVIKDRTEIGEHPFLNQKRMLSLCNEIWVPCGYTKTVLESYGIHSHLIPAPIAIPLADRPPILEALSYIGHVFVAPLHHNFLQSQAQNRAACAEGGSTFLEYVGVRLKVTGKLRIYITIVNPEDFRKNLDAMLRAFYYFARTRNDVLLVVKILTSSSRFHLLDVLSDVIPRKMDSGTAFQTGNIVFFNDFLSDREMTHLFSIADYYLCTSLCEGQNLPLLEAMAHGVVPVTTANTAMVDYITSQNAITIRDLAVANDCIHLAGTIARQPFSIRKSRVEDIYDALERSSELTRTQYAKMSAEARHTVQQNYSPKVVLSRMQSRLRAIYQSMRGKQVSEMEGR